MFSWAISRYEDRFIRFTLKARPDALPSPQKINFWTCGAMKSRCPFCSWIGATLIHMLCNCGKRDKDSLVMKRHNRVGCVIAEAARRGHKGSTMKISEDKRIEHVCALHDDATQKAMRLGLAWEATKEEGRNWWQLVEVTCPCAWIDQDGETLEKAYKNKVGMYDQLRRKISEACLGMEVTQSTIVVGATGVFRKRSQAEFARVTKLTGI
jgi:hypothetical protein